MDNYLNYIGSDPLVAHIEANPFTTVTVKNTVTSPLNEIKSHLAAK